jgi:hypothetical protein
MTIRTLFFRHDNRRFGGAACFDGLAVSLIAVTGTLPLSQALSARTRSDRQYLLIRGEHSPKLLPPAQK